MNTFTQMEAIEGLAVALKIMTNRDKCWDSPMTVEDHVDVKLAIRAALNILRKDMIDKAFQPN
jgi:hypothetical protein